MTAVPRAVAAALACCALAGSCAGAAAAKQGGSGGGGKGRGPQVAQGGGRGASGPTQAAPSPAAAPVRDSGAGKKAKSSSSGGASQPSKTVAAPAAPAPAAKAATATPSPVAPAASVAPAPAAVSAPTSTAHTHRAGARSGATRSRRAPASLGTGLAAAGRALAAATPRAGAATAGAGPARPASVTARRGRHAHRPGGASPLRTVRELVGVVPTAIWILIGALAALALALGASSWLTALRARRLDRQRRELLEDVGLLQAALLPPVPARLGPVSTSAAYRPATGPGAGGDFYDVFALEDGRLAVIVGDVSGHGRPALPQTALVRYTLRAYLEAGLAPRAALQTAAVVLDHQLDASFATVVVAAYDPRERTLTYACAGHPPPVVMGERPLRAVTASSSPPLGAGLPTGMRQTVVSLPGRALVCFHTDGITEARRERALLGEAGLARLLGELGEEPSAETLLDRVAEATDARPDDMAACLLGVHGGPAEPVVVDEELELDREELARPRPARFLAACGLAPPRADEVLRTARATVERTGGAVVHVHGDPRAPRVDVNLPSVEVLHALAERSTVAPLSSAV